MAAVTPDLWSHKYLLYYHESLEQTFQKWLLIKYLLYFVIWLKLLSYFSNIKYKSLDRTLDFYDVRSHIMSHGTGDWFFYRYENNSLVRVDIRIVNFIRQFLVTIDYKINLIVVNIHIVKSLTLVSSAFCSINNQSLLW